jgi:flavorubredoxin
MFEGVYSVPDGVSYNSYLLLDEKTVLFDTVDQAVESVFVENVEYALGGRKLDYLVVHHMEPDHSATLNILMKLYPEATVVCNQKIKVMMQQYFGDSFNVKTLIVNEGDKLETGRHTLTFLMAPMVHWPEVMVTYDITTKTLFSADAFGTFGALNGALFADEVDFFADYLKESRRYYTNIVGKYGTQVQALLKKASAVEIEMICPLHGFVWRRNIGDYIEKYRKWSAYEPEVTGVMIAYASVYGHTENTANILSCKLREKGIRTIMFDVSVASTSEVVAASFEYSHLVFASTTYNAGIFITMDELLRDIASHNLQNRTVAFIENGSWAATSGKLMREIIGSLKNMTIIDKTVSLKSALSEKQLADVDALADAIADTMPKKPEAKSAETTAAAPVGIDNKPCSSSLRSVRPLRKGRRQDKRLYHKHRDSGYRYS